jgi:3-hydroxyisobutyrate dehydrogenase-like beta-hydroxyacid dehydrogenase
MNLEAGFIGLGLMGLPMAENLLAANVSLRVFNRTVSKAQSLAAKGATVVSTPGDAAKPGES